MARDDLARELTQQPSIAVARIAGDPDGHSLWSHYAESWWLPTVGPSTLWLVRRLWVWGGSTTAPNDVALHVLAESLGLSTATGANSPVVRSVTRAISFGLAREHQGRIDVADTVPELPERRRQRLSPQLRDALREPVK